MRRYIYLLVLLCVTMASFGQHSLQVDDGAGNIGIITGPTSGGMVMFSLPSSPGTLITSGTGPMSAWLLQGNALTSAGSSPTQWFGTSTNDDVIMKAFNTEILRLVSGGGVRVFGLTTGIVHSDGLGNLSSSLITNADVDPAAGIVDTKLATISTSGKVSNSATTATDAATTNAIVSRDASKGFSAGRIVIVDQNELRINDADNSNYIGIGVPAIVATSYSLTLPTDDGTPNQVLQTDGGGVLSWVTAGGTVSSVNGTGNNGISITGGPITTSGSLTIGISVNGINYDRIQQVTSGRLLGNSTGAAATMEEISVGSGLSLSSSILSIQPSAVWLTGGNATTPGDGTVYVGTSDLQPLYFKVNGGGTPENRFILYTNSAISLGKNATASQQDALAMGTGSNASGTGGSISIGPSSISSGASGIAIGNGASSTSTGGVAIGGGASSGSNSVAIGPGASAAGANAKAEGFNASAAGNNSVALGQSSSVVATAPNSIAMGSSAVVMMSSSSSVVLGPNAQAQANSNDGVALGSSAVIMSPSSISFGPSAVVQTSSSLSVSMGPSSTILTTSPSSVSIGSSSVVGSNSGSSIALGRSSSVLMLSPSSISIGSFSSVLTSSMSSVSIGGSTNSVNGSQASGTGAIAIGGGGGTAGQEGARATGAGAIALGGFDGTNDGAAASGAGAVAIGNGASSTGARSVVVGGIGNSSAGDNSAIVGGRGLTLDASADNSLGFSAGSSVMTISSPNTVIFANSSIWLANNNSTPSSLVFYEAENGTGAFPSSTKSVSFVSPSVLTTTQSYTLPLDYPTSSGMVLSSTTGGVLSWAAASSGWALFGNSGTLPGTHFLGTTDNGDFHISVRSGATINNSFKFGANGSISRDLSVYTAGGARGNLAVDMQQSRSVATQVASGVGSVISGGGSNTASNSYSTVSGGNSNTVSGGVSTVGGGYFHSVAGDYSAIAGGARNTASGDSTFIGGGLGNIASGDGSFVGGGSYNTAAGKWSLVVGGDSNMATANYATVVGGITDSATGVRSFVGGGTDNLASNQFAVVVGGVGNKANGNRSAILGGGTNKANGNYTSILGGRGMQLDGDRSLGFNANDIALLRDMTIATSDVVVFANVNLWLANNNSTASELRFYEAESGTGAFPSSTDYTAFKAGTQSTDITYTLPTTQPSAGQVLSATSVTGSGPYSVAMGWSSSAQVISGNTTNPLNASASTEYIYPQGLSVTNNTEVVFDANPTVMLISRAGTIKNFYVSLATAPGTAHSRSFTIRVNGVSTAVTLTISGASTTGSDLTNSVSVSANDQISIIETAVDGGAGNPAASRAAWSFSIF